MSVLQIKVTFLKFLRLFIIGYFLFVGIVFWCEWITSTTPLGAVTNFGLVEVSGVMAYWFLKPFEKED